MIKIKYLISFYLSLLLLLLSPMGSEARFLQASTSNSASVIRAYNAALPCGECLLGGNIYCVRGPEQFSGDTPLQGVCCNSISNCSQASNSSWNCSSQYSNEVDKYRVCPFSKNQCGNSTIVSLDGLGDSECIRLKNLSRGNACLYRVVSACGVPNF